MLMQDQQNMLIQDNVCLGKITVTPNISKIHNQITIMACFSLCQHFWHISTHQPIVCVVLSHWRVFAVRELSNLMN